jgi:hypothetical protein
MDSVRDWLRHSTSQFSEELALEIAGALVFLAATPVGEKQVCAFLGDFLGDLSWKYPSGERERFAPLLQWVVVLDAALASGGDISDLCPKALKDVTPWVAGALEVIAHFPSYFTAALLDPSHRRHLIPLLVWLENEVGISALQLSEVDIQELRKASLGQFAALAAYVHTLARQSVARRKRPS